MNNGKRSYFSANSNASNVPKNDVQEGEVELEIKELNLEGELSGDVSGKTEVSGSDSKALDDNSNQNSSESSADVSDTQDVSDSSDFSEGDDTTSSEESSDDSLDDMEDVSDDNEDNNLEEKKDDSEDEKDDKDDKEKKDDEDKKDDDRENKNPDEKQKLDENGENKDPNNEPTDGKEQPENEDKGSSNEESNNSNDNENKPESNDDTASKSSQNEDSSNSQDSDKSTKKDDQSKPQDESNNQSKEPSSSKKKDDNQGGLPKNKQKGRSPQDIKNNLKNNLKDRLNPKNMAQNAFNRSKLGQGINKARNAVNNAKKAANFTKKAAKGAAKVGKAAAKGAAKAAQGLAHFFINTLPWSAIVIGVILIIVLIVMLIAAIAPGSNDNVNDGTSSYTKADQKTLEKMRKLFNKYPNADGSLAMAVVLYPYYDILHGTEVRNYLELGTDEEPVDIEDDTIIDEDNEGDTEDIEDEDIEEDEDNDIYLEPFRKYTVRNKLKKILKELNNSTEEAFENYLINEYFKKDKGYLSYDGGAFNGYKELFDSVPSSKHDVLAEAIIADLYDIKDVFINYVFTPQVCSSSSTSLGYSDGTDLIKGQAVVVLKDTKATSISSIKSSPTLFGTDDYHMDLKRYVLGVGYAEVDSYMNNEEYAKAHMIAIKSFVLARTYPGGTGAGMNRTPDYEGDRTIFYMKNSTDDQVFCDVYEGCQSGSRYALDTITPDNGPGINPKPPLSQDKITLLEQWYDETAGKFIYNANTEEYYSSYVADSYYTYCQKGSCLLQTAAHQDALNGSGYEAILKKYYSNDEFVIKDIETNTLSAVSVACSSVLNGGCTIPEDEFIYYSQRSYSNNFCGRTDGTISSSGCGVTSMAMVVANLTDNKLTPVDTMNEAHQGGYCGAGIYGTSSSYFSVAASKYGLTYESIPSSDNSLDADKKIKDTLNSGGLIIANVAGSETAGSGNAWSTVSNGHYLVIKGITADEKLIIADPMTTALNNPWKNNLTIEEMRSYMNDRSFYLFTGGKADEIKDKYCSSKGAGYLGNPLNPNDFTSSFMSSGNASCFPNYCDSGSPHGAVDIALSEGTPIYAMDSGIVEVSRWNISWGNYVLINHGNGYKTLYAHFSELGVSEGQQVTKGQLIGKSGNTGNSTGPHLHIELQNIALYNANGRTAAKSSNSKGLMNPAKYINSNVSYVGQSN